MNTDTLPRPSGNEDPDAVSTATEGGNEPLTEAEMDVISKLLKGVRRLPFQRISKHRGGRVPPLTPKQRKRRAAIMRRGEQASKHLYLEHKKDREALERAMSGE